MKFFSFIHRHTRRAIAGKLTILGVLIISVLAVALASTGGIGTYTDPSQLAGEGRTYAAGSYVADGTGSFRLSSNTSIAGSDYTYNPEYQLGTYYSTSVTAPTLIINTGTDKEFWVTTPDNTSAGNPLRDTYIIIKGSGTVHLENVYLNTSTDDYLNVLAGEILGIISVKDGSPTIILEGNNDIRNDAPSNSTTERRTYLAGIHINEGCTLTIDGTGSLTSKGGYYGAGIGSCREFDGGNVVIGGGTISAQGGYSGTGIGSGYSGAFGNITINGGKVTASCASRKEYSIGDSANQQSGSVYISPYANVSAAKVMGAGNPPRSTVNNATSVYKNLLQVGVSPLANAPILDIIVDGRSVVSDGYTANSSSTDKDGIITLWLPVNADADTAEVTVIMEDGSRYYRAFARQAADMVYSVILTGEESSDPADANILGPYIITGASSGYTVDPATNLLTISTSTPLTIRSKVPGQIINGRIVMQDVNADITLNGINLQSGSNPTLKLANGNLRLTLAPGSENSLTATNYSAITWGVLNTPVMTVAGGGILNISGADSDGYTIDFSNKESFTLESGTVNVIGTIHCRLGSINITGGTLTQTNISANAIGLRAKTTNISGGILETAGSIYILEGSVDISGGKVNIGCSSGRRAVTGSSSVGMNISGGTITVADDGGDLLLSTTITGGSVNASIVNPVNGSGEPVYKNTLTVRQGGSQFAGIALDGPGLIDGNSDFNSAGTAYGTTDMVTDEQGKVYVWASATPMDTGGQTRYIGYIELASASARYTAATDPGSRHGYQRSPDTANTASLLEYPTLSINGVRNLKCDSSGKAVPFDLTVTGPGDMVGYEIKYAPAPFSSIRSRDWDGTTLLDPGTYEIRLVTPYNVRVTQLYMDHIVYASFSVDPYEGTDVPYFTNHPSGRTDLVYSEQPQPLISEGEIAINNSAAVSTAARYYVSHYAVSPSLSDPSWSYDIPQGTEAGTYYVYYNATYKNTSGVTNTAEYIGGPIPVTIAPAEASAYTPPQAALGLTFTGELQPLLTAPGRINGGAVKYYLVSTAAQPPTNRTLFTESIPERSNAGDYHIYYYIEGSDDGNYTASDITGPVEVSIGKTDPVYAALPSARSLTYTGLEQQLINMAVANYGTPYYRFYTEAQETLPFAGVSGGWTSDVSAVKAGAAGDYYVYYYIKGDLNHTDTEVVGPIRVDILESLPEGYYLPVPNQGLTYNGSPQQLFNGRQTTVADADKMSNVEVYITTAALAEKPVQGDDTSWINWLDYNSYVDLVTRVDNSSVERTDAGTYYCYFRLVNYRSLVIGPVTVKINKVPLEVEWSYAGGTSSFAWDYNAAARPLTASITGTGSTLAASEGVGLIIKYKKQSEADESYSLAAKVNAGNYMAQASIAGAADGSASNYYVQKNATRTFTINKASPNGRMFSFESTTRNVSSPGDPPEITVFPEDGPYSHYTGMGDIISFERVQINSSDYPISGSLPWPPTAVGKYGIGVGVAEGDNFLAGGGFAFSWTSMYFELVNGQVPDAGLFEANIYTHAVAAPLSTSPVMEYDGYTFGVYGSSGVTYINAAADTGAVVSNIKYRKVGSVAAASSSMPRNAGEYEVLIDFSGSNTYASVTNLSIGTFTIKRKDVNVVWSTEPLGADPQTPKAPGATAVTGISADGTLDLSSLVQGQKTVPGGPYTASLPEYPDAFPNYRLLNTSTQFYLEGYNLTAQLDFGALGLFQADAYAGTQASSGDIEVVSSDVRGYEIDIQIDGASANLSNGAAVNTAYLYALTADGAMQDDKWAYSITTGGFPSTWFAPSTARRTIIKTNKASPMGTRYKLWVGTKLTSETKSGTYTGRILITVTGRTQ